MNAYDIIQPWLTNPWRRTSSSASSSLFASSKAQIARAIETIFDVEVAKVNVRNSKHGKHASVKRRRYAQKMTPASGSILR